MISLPFNLILSILSFQTEHFQVIPDTLIPQLSTSIVAVCLFNLWLSSSWYPVYIIFTLSVPISPHCQLNQLSSLFPLFQGYQVTSHMDLIIAFSVLFSLLKVIVVLYVTPSAQFFKDKVIGYLGAYRGLIVSVSMKCNSSYILAVSSRPPVLQSWRHVSVFCCGSVERPIAWCQMLTVAHVELLGWRAARLGRLADEFCAPHESGRRVWRLCARGPEASAFPCVHRIRVNDAGVITRIILGIILLLGYSWRCSRARFVSDVPYSRALQHSRRERMMARPIVNGVFMLRAGRICVSARMW